MDFVILPHPTRAGYVIFRSLVSGWDYPCPEAFAESVKEKLRRSGVRV